MRASAVDAARARASEVVTVRYRRLDASAPPSTDAHMARSADSSLSASDTSDEEWGTRGGRPRGRAHPRRCGPCVRTSRTGGGRGSRVSCACVAAVLGAVLVLLGIGMVVDRPGFGGGGLGTAVQLPQGDRVRLRRERYFIAMNVYNSETTLTTAVPQVLRLVKTLGASRCMVSVYENGSTDRSFYLLQVLCRHLMSQGVRTDIESDAWHGWWNACPEAGISCDSDTCRRRCAPPPADAPHTAAPRLAERPDMYEEELRAACGELRSCEARVRVPVMATLRNRALRGLSEYMGMHPGDNVRVLFLHDTFFTAEQVVELLLTHGMSYDVACAMDFEGTRLHDVWAARDQAGEAFDAHYPFVAEPAAQAALRANEPFRVYSCWNGAVVLPGNALVEHGITFRTWREGEPVSPHPAASGLGRTFSDECPAAESQLLLKDLWQAGYTRVWMNPRVKLAYNTRSHYVQRWLVRWVNALVLHWFRVLPPRPGHAAQRDALLPGVTSGDAKAPAPLEVACSASPRSSHELQI